MIHLSRMWDEIIDALPNLHGWAVEVEEWIRNFISRILMDVITYPCWLRLIHVNKNGS